MVICSTKENVKEFMELKEFKEFKNTTSLRLSKIP